MIGGVTTPLRERISANDLFIQQELFVGDLHRFKLGDKVRASSTMEFYGDWQHTEMTVIGVALDLRMKKVNITVLHDGDCVTDGFVPTDLTPVAK